MPLSSPATSLPANLVSSLNVLEEVNGTSHQRLSIYESNVPNISYSRFSIDFDYVSGFCSLHTEGVGTPARAVFFTAGASGGTIAAGIDGTLTMGRNTVANYWQMVVGGHWQAWSDNTIDIGGNGFGRPRSIYAATSIQAGSYLKSGSSTVALLPTATAAGTGARHFVTDATATSFLTIVAGGGANKVPVVSDGTNWLVG